MTFFPAPGVAQLRVTGTIGPNPFATVLHWWGGAAAPWTQSQIQALATSGLNHWNTNLTPLFASTVVSIQCDTVDLSDQTERAGLAGPGSTPGGTPGHPPTLGACILISHKIGRRVRGGHPRTYLPGSAAVNTSDGDTWTGSFLATVDTDWAAFINGIKSDMVAAGLASNNQCCPAYSYTYTADNTKHKFVKTRTGFIGAFPITAASTSRNQIATQRRRLGV